MIKTAMQIDDKPYGMANITKTRNALGSQASDSIYGIAEGNLLFVSEHTNR
jgi:hypothetical protein